LRIALSRADRSSNAGATSDGWRCQPVETKRRRPWPSRTSRSSRSTATSTANYDTVVAKLDLQGTASLRGSSTHGGFDHDAGVFRIFDVWQTRAYGERHHDRLDPISS
jgi:hypothetical protein